METTTFLILICTALLICIVGLSVWVYLLGLDLEEARIRSTVYYEWVERHSTEAKEEVAEEPSTTYLCKYMDDAGFNSTIRNVTEWLISDGFLMLHTKHGTFLIPADREFGLMKQTEEDD